MLFGTTKKHTTHIGSIEGYLKATKRIEKQTETPLESAKFFWETKELLARSPCLEGIVECPEAELVQALSEHGRHLCYREGNTQGMSSLIARWSGGMHPPKNLPAYIRRQMRKKPHKTFNEVTARDQNIEGNLSP